MFGTTTLLCSTLCSFLCSPNRLLLPLPTPPQQHHYSVVSFMDSIKVNKKNTLSLHMDNPNNNNNSNNKESSWSTLVENNPSTDTATRFQTTQATTTTVLLLNLVAILWGSQHAVIKEVMESSDASIFTLLRFSLAALIASPYTPSLFEFLNKNNNNNDDNNNNNNNITTWRWGIEMGLWMFLGFSFQAIGLETTTAQRSGFLLYLNVKLVPFFAYLFFGRTIRISTWISAFMAFTGTALLATDTTNSGVLGIEDDIWSHWNVGDIWSIAAAVASAMFILRLERATTQVSNTAQFNAASLWVVAFLSMIWTLLSWNNSNSNEATEVFIHTLWETATTHTWEIVYLGGVATALTNWIQSKAQKGISAERAAIIYAMDPVYGAFFAHWFLQESLGGPQAWIGASMITIAAATNALLDFQPSSLATSSSSSLDTTNNKDNSTRNPS